MINDTTPRPDGGRANLPPRVRPAMTPEAFCEAGQATYGSRWMIALSRRLTLSWALIQDYSKGHRKIPENTRLAVLYLEANPGER